MSNQDSISFAFPVDCVMLTNAAGQLTNKGLEINCILSASPGRKISVNGILCNSTRDDEYRVKIILKDYRTTLAAVDIETGERVAIKVFYLKKAHKKYRFSLDDNIWFFQNIAKNKDIYKSIFEDPYLKLLKTMNDRYGTKFHLNIYYECPEFGGFNLTQMPDKFKPEWKYNSDWLRLSFHANANLPTRPYIRASFSQAKFEHDRIMNEILRFAGEEAFAGSATTIHWGDATVDAVRALRSSGVRAFVGAFRYHYPNNNSIRYYLNAEQCAILNIYGFYYEKKEDVCFVLYGPSIQRTTIDDIAEESKVFQKNHPLYTFKELCVHEQYFYPHFARYMPDYYERFDTAIRWCVENGYESAFLSDILEDTLEF